MFFIIKYLCDTDVGKKLGIIIGPKGAMLNQLQETYEVTIQVPKTGDDNESVCVVGVSSENVNKVIKIIHDLSTKGYSGLLMSGGSEKTDNNSNVFMERSMQVPTRYVYLYKCRE